MDKISLYVKEEKLKGPSGGITLLQVFLWPNDETQ